MDKADLDSFDSSLCLYHAEANERYELSDRHLRVGRSSQNDIQLLDATVSYIHASINNGYLIDLDSTNGTYLNGKRLHSGKKHHLKPGDQIRFGKFNLIVESVIKAENLLSSTDSESSDAETDVESDSSVISSLTSSASMESFVELGEEEDSFNFFNEIEIDPEKIDVSKTTKATLKDEDVDNFMHTIENSRKKSAVWRKEQKNVVVKAPADFAQEFVESSDDEEMGNFEDLEDFLQSEKESKIIEEDDGKEEVKGKREKVGHPGKTRGMMKRPSTGISKSGGQKHSTTNEVRRIKSAGRGTGKRLSRGRGGGIARGRGTGTGTGMKSNPNSNIPTLPSTKSTEIRKVKVGKSKPIKKGMKNSHKLVGSNRNVLKHSKAKIMKKGHARNNSVVKTEGKKDIYVFKLPEMIENATAQMKGLVDKTSGRTESLNQYLNCDLKDVISASSRSLWMKKLLDVSPAVSIEKVEKAKEIIKKMEDDREHLLDEKGDETSENRVKKGTIKPHTVPNKSKNTLGYANATFEAALGNCIEKQRNFREKIVSWLERVSASQSIENEHDKQKVVEESKEVYLSGKKIESIDDIDQVELEVQLKKIEKLHESYLPIVKNFRKALSTTQHCIESLEKSLEEENLALNRLKNLENLITDDLGGNIKSVERCLAKQLLYRSKEVDSISDNMNKFVLECQKKLVKERRDRHVRSQVNKINLKLRALNGKIRKTEKDLVALEKKAMGDEKQSSEAKRGRGGSIRGDRNRGSRGSRGSGRGSRGSGRGSRGSGRGSRGRGRGSGRGGKLSRTSSQQLDSIQVKKLRDDREKCAALRREREDLQAKLIELRGKLSTSEAPSLSHLAFAAAVEREPEIIDEGVTTLGETPTGDYVTKGETPGGDTYETPGRVAAGGKIDFGGGESDDSGDEELNDMLNALGVDENDLKSDDENNSDENVEQEEKSSEKEEKSLHQEDINMDNESETASEKHQKLVEKNEEVLSDKPEENEDAKTEENSQKKTDDTEETEISNMKVEDNIKPENEPVLLKENSVIEKEPNKDVPSSNMNLKQDKLNISSPTKNLESKRKDSVEIKDPNAGDPLNWLHLLRSARLLKDRSLEDDYMIIKDGRVDGGGLIIAELLGIDSIEKSKSDLEIRDIGVDEFEEPVMENPNLCILQSLDKSRFAYLRHDLIQLYDKTHPYVVPVQACFIEKAEELFYIQNSHCTNGTLTEWLARRRGRIISNKKMEADHFDNIIKSIFHCILDGLSHMHDHDVVHSGLHPDSIWMTSEQTPRILYEFNPLQVKVGDSEEDAILPSDGFKPPEELKFKHNYRKRKHKSSDIYSIGLILYYYIVGILNNARVESFSENVCMPVHPEKAHVHKYRLDPDFFALVNEMTDPDPKKRPTLSQALNHKYFTKQDEKNEKDEAMKEEKTNDEDVELDMEKLKTFFRTWIPASSKWLRRCWTRTSWLMGKSAASLDTDYKMISVDPISQEYEKISERFYARGGADKTISSVHRVENRGLYSLYSFNHFQMNSNFDESGSYDVFVSEKTHLFYGTTGVNVPSICKTGFNHLRYGVNGHGLGHGSYFHTRASDAHKFSPVNSSGKRFMFVCHVLVGETVTSKTVARTDIVSKPFIVLVDDLKDPSVYIVTDVNHVQTYPAYLVTYE